MKTLLILAVLLPSTSSQVSPDAPAKLTGPSYKVWIETAITTTLGSDRQCTEGREYRFTVDGTGALRACIDNRIVESPFSWEHRTDGIDDFITFRDQEYRLILSDHVDPQSGLDYEEALLRIEQVRSTQTIDLVLRRFP